MQKREYFKEVNRLAALNISKALSTLCGNPVEAKITEANILKNTFPLPKFDVQSTVAGVYLPVSGSIKGGALVTFIEKTPFALSDLLLKKESGATIELDEMDKSAIAETGNIIAGSYFASISNKLNARIVARIPQFSMDSFINIALKTIAPFVQKSQGALLTIEMELFFKSEVHNGYILIFLDSEAIESKLGYGLDPNVSFD